MNILIFRNQREALHHNVAAKHPDFGEEDMVSRLLMNVLAEAYDLDYRLPLPLVEGDSLLGDHHDLVRAASMLYQGEIDRRRESGGSLEGRIHR